PCTCRKHEMTQRVLKKRRELMNLHEKKLLMGNEDVEERKWCYKLGNYKKTFLFHVCT
ncbi:mCG145542, partial [Mus musculus]